MAKKITKSEKRQQCCLTPEQYKITREKCTETAFSGKYCHFKGEGVFKCVCCGTKLFSSETKYDSGCGWPSFWKPMEGSITEKEDNSLFRKRTEVVCSKCEAHLGHVFTDGPQPTGLRYCINSGALKFEKKKEKSRKSK